MRILEVFGSTVKPNLSISMNQLSSPNVENLVRSATSFDSSKMKIVLVVAVVVRDIEGRKNEVFYNDKPTQICVRGVMT